MSGDRILIIADGEVGPRIAAYVSEGCWLSDNIELGSAALALAMRRGHRLALMHAPRVAHSHTLFCQTLREMPESRDLLLIGLTEPDDAAGRLRLLDCGADDCWSEPFHSEEFRLRLKRIHALHYPGRSMHVLERHGIELDVEQHKVRVDGQPVRLTPTQMMVLRHFLEHPGTTFSRSDLLQHVWSAPDLQVETVTACIRSICRALSAAGPVTAIRKVGPLGYRMD